MQSNESPGTDIAILPETQEAIQGGYLYAGYYLDGRKLAVSIRDGSVFARIMTDRLGNVLHIQQPLENLIEIIRR